MLAHGSRERTGAAYAVERPPAAEVGAADSGTRARRRPRQSIEAIDRSARQARRIFWRQIPYYRLRFIELSQFGCAAHLRPDAIQGTQPVASLADGLVLSAPGNERVSRPAAGAAAARRGDLVPRHSGCSLPEL